MQWFFRRQGPMPCLLRKVIVNLLDGETAIEGVLFEQRGEWCVLKDAKLLVTGRPATTMDGDVVISCAQIAFIQALGS